jgi:uncharacterized protein
MIEAAPLAWGRRAAAFAAGLTGSLHCALMCGPLACAPLPRAGGAGRASALVRLAPAADWPPTASSARRWGSPARGWRSGLARYVQPVLPWLMVAGFVASAFEFGRRLPVSRRARRRGAPPGALGRARLAVRRAPSALGAATPLLPCGLLWGIFLVAIGAGSAVGRGGAIMVAFGLGSTPGLAAVQLGAAWSGRWPRAERMAQGRRAAGGGGCRGVARAGGGRAGRGGTVTPGTARRTP